MNRLAALLTAAAFTAGACAQDHELCVRPDDAGCTGPICGLHPRIRSIGQSALITEQSLTPERHADDLQVLSRARDVTYMKTAPGDFLMAVTSAQRSSHAYELKKRYEVDRTDAAKKEFCEWLDREGFHPE